MGNNEREKGKKGKLRDRKGKNRKITREKREKWENYEREKGKLPLCVLARGGPTHWHIWKDKCSVFIQIHTCFLSNCISGPKKW